jgi:hypothetical protein
MGECRADRTTDMHGAARADDLAGDRLIAPSLVNGQVAPRWMGHLTDFSGEGAGFLGNMLQRAGRFWVLDGVFMTLLASIDDPDLAGSAYVCCCRALSLSLLVSTHLVAVDRAARAGVGGLHG